VKHGKGMGGKSSTPHEGNRAASRKAHVEGEFRKFTGGFEKGNEGLSKNKKKSEKS